MISTGRALYNCNLHLFIPFINHIRFTSELYGIYLFIYFPNIIISSNVKGRLGLQIFKSERGTRFSEHVTS